MTALWRERGGHRFLPLHRPADRPRDQRALLLPRPPVLPHPRPLQADQIGTGGGVNLYGYVSNDPLNATDPDGLIASLGYDFVQALNPVGSAYAGENPTDAPAQRLEEQEEQPVTPLRPTLGPKLEGGTPSGGTRGAVVGPSSEVHQHQASLEPSQVLWNQQTGHLEIHRASLTAGYIQVMHLINCRIKAFRQALRSKR